MISTVMASHVDELSGSACSIESSFDDGLRQTDERDHGTVGRQTRVHVQQRAAVRRRYRIGDRLDRLHTQPSQLEMVKNPLISWVRVSWLVCKIRVRVRFAFCHYEPKAVKAPAFGWGPVGGARPLTRDTVVVVPLRTAPAANHGQQEPRQAVGLTPCLSQNAHAHKTIIQPIHTAR